MNGLIQCQDTLSNEEMESLIKAGYAIVMILANDLLNENNIKLIRTFYEYFWSKFMNHTQDIQNTKFYYVWIGHMLRCNLEIKWMNVNS